jgi:hypothetical protein
MRIHKRTVDLSGFGGGYEAMCQTMLWRGVQYLAEVKPPLTMWKDAKSFKNVYGLVMTEGADLKALEVAILKPGEDATGAMHHAVMATLRYIHKHGVDHWLAEVEKEAPDRIYETDVELGPVPA